jgi:photosystem II stability/assembly factor-like uncharacterized protein
MKRPLTGVRALSLILFVAGCSISRHAAAGINSWTTSGPEAGRIEQIVVDPGNASNIFVITPYGGVFKTADGGLTWRAANRGNTAISALRLAMDPLAPATLYVAAQQGGVFKTIDSAENWSAANTGLSGVVVSTVAVDPVQPLNVYAGTAQHGVYKSTDGGALWIPANLGLIVPIDALAVDPSAPSTLYVAGVTGLFKSIDAGTTWFASGNGLTSNAHVITVDPRASSIVYVGTDSASIYKSIDGGQSWAPASTGLTPDGSIADIAIDPRDSNRLLVAQRSFFLGDAIFLTENGGATWTELPGVVTGLGSAVAFHPTVATTLFGGVTISAFRGSFLKSTDGGQSWTESTRGLSGSLVTPVAADPFAPGTAYSSAFPRIYKTTDYGETWTHTATLTSGVNAFVVDPSHRHILYAATRDGVFKSLDGGVQWTPVNDGLTDLEVLSLGIDKRGKTLYAGTAGGIFRSDDGARRWKPTSALPDPFPFVWTLAVDPVHWKTVYARSGSGLVKTTDGGAHWTILPDAPRYASRIAMDPTRRETLFVAAEFELSRSSDGGETWFQAANGLPYPNVLNPQLAMDPSNPSALYFSPFAGAFRTMDGGGLWTPLSEGLFWGFEVFGLSVNATGDTIYAATYGGVYSYRFGASP